MTRDEKAARDAANIPDGKETVLQDGNTAPALNNNIRAGRAQAVDYLLTGRSNAKTAAELSRVMGIPRRDVMAQLQTARMRGERVCSSPGFPAGYWLAEVPAELETNIKELSRRAREQRQTIDAMTRTLEKWTGQEAI